MTERAQTLGGGLHNATIYGCHSDTETGGAREAGGTFEAFLVHDDGVVLRRLRQAEELTSEWDKNQERRVKIRQPTR